MFTGWYGQYLPYPGFTRASGLTSSIALISGISIGLYWTFRRNNRL